MNELVSLNDFMGDLCDQFDHTNQKLKKKQSLNESQVRCQLFEQRKINQRDDTLARYNRPPVSSIGTVGP